MDLRDAPRTGADEVEHRRLIAEALNRGLSVLRSKGTFTLTTGATSTVVTNTGATMNCVVVFSPETANAAAALSTTYKSASTNGQFTITHANDVTTDRTFGYFILG